MDDLLADSHSILTRSNNYFCQLLNVPGVNSIRQTEIYTAEPLLLLSSQQCKIFLSSTVSRLTLGPTQPPIQWLPGALSPWIKWQGRDANLSPPSSADVKKGGAIPPLPHMSSWHSA
jgi:hypothetical protein